MKIALALWGLIAQIVGLLLFAYVALPWALAYLWDFVGISLIVPVYNAESVIIFYLLWNDLCGNRANFIRAMMRLDRGRKRRHV